MEQYLTHYKHTVGITVGFRDVGDVANTGGSVNYKVSIWKWDVISNINMTMTHLTIRVGFLVGSAVTGDSVTGLGEGWGVTGETGLRVGAFVVGFSVGAFVVGWGVVTGDFVVGLGVLGFLVVGLGVRGFLVGLLRWQRKGKWCYGLLLLEMKHEWDKEDIKKNIFLLTLLGVSLVSLCGERLETKMEKVWGQVLDDMLWL